MYRHAINVLGILDTHQLQNCMSKIAMPPQDLVVLGWVLWQEIPACHKIRLATLVALRLIVFPSHRRGIIATRIILVTQTMEVLVTPNLMLQIQRVATE